MMSNVFYLLPNHYNVRSFIRSKELRIIPVTNFYQNLLFTKQINYDKYYLLKLKIVHRHKSKLGAAIDVSVKFSPVPRQCRLFLVNCCSVVDTWHNCANAKCKQPKCHIAVKTINVVNDNVLLSLFLTFNIFHTFFYSFFY